MPQITDAQRVAEVCHEALTAALHAVRADAELRSDADYLALQAYEACQAATDVSWEVYASRRTATLDAAEQRQTTGAETENLKP